MSGLEAIILGVIEGVTEFLPISSTGHLILFSKFLSIAESEFLKSFEIIIQLGAILAVIILYFKTLTTSLKTSKLILTAFLPTATIGLLFYSVIKNSLLSNANIVVWALALGGLTLIIFEYFHEEKPTKSIESGIRSVENITYKQALIIGLAQSLALVPGVSRAAATIIGGLSLGLSRETIVHFSFLLAIPTMIAAAGLDLIKNVNTFSPQQFGLLTIGFVASFFTAIIAVRFLLKYIKQHDFTAFGFYRIALALIFWFSFLK